MYIWEVAATRCGLLVRWAESRIAQLKRADLFPDRRITTCMNFAQRRLLQVHETKRMYRAGRERRPKAIAESGCMWRTPSRTTSPGEITIGKSDEENLSITSGAHVSMITRKVGIAQPARPSLIGLAALPSVRSVKTTSGQTLKTIAPSLRASANTSKKASHVKNQFSVFQPGCRRIQLEPDWKCSERSASPVALAGRAAWCRPDRLRGIGVSMRASFLHEIPRPNNPGEHFQVPRTPHARR